MIYVLFIGFTLTTYVTATVLVLHAAFESCVGTHQVIGELSFGGVCSRQHAVYGSGLLI